MQRVLRPLFLVCAVVVCCRATPIQWQEAYGQFIQATPAAHFPPQIPPPEQIAVTPAKTVKTQLLREQNNQPTDAATKPHLSLPESGTLLLLGSGLAGLAALMRRKRPLKK